MGAHKTCQERRDNHSRKIVVYHGYGEEDFSFITTEAYHHLKGWIKYRQDCGEKTNEDTWAMRQQLQSTKLGSSDISKTNIS
jgi:hypothetical protein